MIKAKPSTTHSTVIPPAQLAEVLSLHRAPTPLTPMSPRPLNIKKLPSILRTQGTQLPKPSVKKMNAFFNPNFLQIQADIQQSDITMRSTYEITKTLRIVFLL